MASEVSSVAPPKIGFVSLGCPKNLVDSEVMMGLVSRSGAELTSSPDQADIIVVNTCSFIDSAKQESVDAILEMARHKRSEENPSGKATKLIVAGCLVERYRTEIRKEIPEVDAVIGTGELEGILSAAGLSSGIQSASASPFQILNSRPEAAARAQQGRFSRNEWEGAIADLPNYLYDESTPRVRATAGHAAYIKIAEGCDHPCSFCIIPQLRGTFRSRRFESVVAEAERLAAEGVREITLIGQDTTCYGEDFGLKDGLAALLERLAQIEELRWVRFLYAYPNKVTPKLLETIAEHPKICSYIDVPLQHASAPVLKAMKRGGSADIFLKMIERIRRTVPNVTLRTSFIVGFPGEREQDFETLQDFVRAAEFDWLGVFGYSDEEGSGAFQPGRKLSAKEIERRRKELMKKQQQISRRKKRKLLGKEFEVLLEGPSAETELLWQGRTEMHAPEIDGDLFIRDFGPHSEARAGEFYKCRVVETHDYDLVAELM